MRKGYKGEYYIMGIMDDLKNGISGVRAIASAKVEEVERSTMGKYIADPATILGPVSYMNAKRLAGKYDSSELREAIKAADEIQAKRDQDEMASFIADPEKLNGMLAMSSAKSLAKKYNNIKLLEAIRKAEEEKAAKKAQERTSKTSILGSLKAAYAEAKAEVAKENLEMAARAKKDAELGVWTTDRLTVEINRVADDGTASIISRQGLELLAPLMFKNEVILAAAGGGASPFALNIGTGCTLGIATDRRFILVRQKNVGVKPEIVPYDMVNSVTMTNGVATTDVVVYDGAGKHVLKRVFGVKEAESFVRAMNAAVEEFRSKHHGHDQQLATSSVRILEDDPITKIERLANLKDKGLISEKEFVEQKAKLLAAM